jgi:hypothetical protein
MFLGMLKTHHSLAEKDHRHKPPFNAPDQGSDSRMLHDGSPFVAMG